MKKISTLLILALIIIPLKIFSQEIFVLNNKDLTNSSLSPYIYVLEDSENSFDIEEVKQKFNEGNYQKYDTIAKKLNPKSAYWGRFQIVSNLENDTYWLVNFKAASSLRLNFLEAYIFDNSDNLLQISEFGFSKPASQITNPKQRDHFELLLPKKDTLEVYLKIRNITNWHPTFNVELSDETFLSEKKQQKNLIKLFYEGMLWIFILYNLLTFIITKDRAYLYYSLYFFGSALYTLFINKYLLFTILAEVPKLETVFWLLSIGPGTIFYFMFMRNFINTRNLLNKGWNTVINTYIFIKIGIILLELILLATTYNIRLINSITVYSNIAEFFLSIIFIIRLSRTKNPLAYFFIAGSLFLWTGFVAANVLYMIGNPYNSYVGELGVAGELLIFSLGLGYRFRKNEEDKQKAQQELINQLERNKQLQTKVNRELEQKVKERTEEIMSQKDELEKHRDKIMIQNKSISEKNKILEIQKKEIETKNDFLHQKQQRILVQNEILNQNREEILAQNEELERQRNIAYVQKQKITDSIVYAKRIQQAVLPTAEKMKSIFENYFVLYMPRDIVSGDFLWAKQFDNQKIIAVADCTGHGVPGAFVSMLGIAMLNEIIQKNSDLRPNIILEKLRKYVKLSFNQHGARNEAKDGMDISLAVIDTENKKIQYAGAYNSLILVRGNYKRAESMERVVTIKGDRQPIAVYIKESPFTLNEIDYHDYDKIYFTTDGYTDQFNSHNKKFLPKRFKDLLEEIRYKPVSEQKQVLYDNFKQWKGNRNQIDDVLVVGIELD